MKKIPITVAIIVTIAGIVYGLIRYFNLPPRVDKLEESVDRVADEVAEFVVEQRVLEEGRDKREMLMLEIIRDK